MNRVAIKERSKQILKKNHWLCVGVAFLATLSLGMFAGGGTSYNFSYTQGGGNPSATTPFADVEPALVIGVIIFALVGLAISFVSQIFLTNQLMVGSCRFFLKFRRNNPVDTGELFQSYKDKTFLNIAKVTFIRDLSVGLWTLLFIVPGIIKSYEYWAVDYILAVKPDTTYNKALDLSKKMMEGHKMEVFELGLSFFGWYLLSIFTCGLLAVCYVNPYQRIAMAELYSEIREDTIKRGIVSPYDVPDYMDYQPQSPYYPYYNVNSQQPQYGGYYAYPAGYPQPADPTASMATDPAQNPAYTPYSQYQTPAQYPQVPQQPVQEDVSQDAISTQAENTDATQSMFGVPDMPEEPEAPDSL